jgi:SAM-dependent methyltransferase
MEFNNSYTDYWKNRVSSLSDGTKIADDQIMKSYLPLLNIQRDDRLLDIGCSFGRFYDVLSENTTNVYGLDIEPSAIAICKGLGYKDLKVCPMESIAFESNSFDKALCWATFDCVDQEKALLEVNRILKTGGRLAITGKNHLYEANDNSAFIAERNAKLKKFPNHFTNINILISLLPQLGFKLIALTCFINRGDFGLNKFVVYNGTLPDAFYEYLIVLEKIDVTSITTFRICDLYSETAALKASDAGYNTDIYEFFKWHKENFENE